MGAAYVVSGVLGSLFSFLIPMADSWWLLLPHSVSPKLADGSMMRNIYGPLCGVPRMDLVDGVLVIAVMYTILVCVWILTPTASLLALLSFGFATPFLANVGFYMALPELLPGMAPLAFVFISSLFGFNLVWRTVDPAFGLPAAHVPLVVAWFGLCSLIIAGYAYRMTVRLPFFKNTIKLEKLKAKAVNADGKTWVRGAAFPEGFAADKALVKASADELAAAQYTPGYLLAGVTLLLLVLLGAAAHGIDPATEASRGPAYVALLVVVVLEVSYAVAVVTAVKGGMGRKDLL